MSKYDQEDLAERPEGLNLEASEEALYVYKNYDQQKVRQREAIRNQLKMPNWPVQEDIVISGMSGRFPESANINEFAHNLYSNTDMVVEDDKRWPLGYLGLPKGSGKIKDIAAFDNKFFYVNEKEANLMDSQVRIMLEITFEALWDAGIDPASLAGTNTGVFLGNCFDEYMAAYAEDGINMPDYRQCFFAMLHNVYDFRGPAKNFDTACASGFSAMHQAVVSLRAGECERAIVVGLNICLRAGVQNQFMNLNMLSPDGHCKCLDDDANGYAKAEACVAVVLQQKPEAKRIYATIIHTKTNCDGYKDLGITYPSFELQREVLQDTYIESEMDPLKIEYCEAHCTGTQAGDPSEMRAIVETMCVGRTKPLLIGAIKSVMGHSEAASGLCSLVKTILSFENELIPANLHMSKINHRIEGLVSGILQPVTVNTPYHGRFIALNCFGFGGVNVHAIIEKNPKEFVSKDFGPLPRLVTLCGRKEEMLNNFYQFMVNNPEKVTADFLALLNEVSKTSPYPSKMFKGMRYRGFSIFTPDDNQLMKVSTELKFNKIKDKVKPPVCFVFTGMGCQWPAMGRELNQIDIMSSVFEQCSQALKTFDSNFDLMNLLTSDDPKLLQSPTNSFVAIAAIQIALIELLKKINIEPDFMIGHSIGELTCAYADKCLTIQEAIGCAYIRGKCVEEILAVKNGKMAALGCTWQQALELCEKFSNGNVWPACHNSLDSVTVAGSQQDIDSFLEQVQQNDPELFVRPINSSNVAFHCPSAKDLEEPLLNDLDHLIKSTKQISSKWLSTTYEQKTNEFNAKYLVDNLINPVRFYEVFQHLPSNAIFVEIAPHNLLQSVIKRNIFERNNTDTVKYVATLSRKGSQESLKVLLENIGLLYINGLNPEISRLYPKVEYPVARKTASLHSLFQWKHDKKFKCTMYPEFFNHAIKHQTMKAIDLQHQNEKFYADHCIDGRILFPATGYLFMAWEIVAKVLNVEREELPIIFEDVTLHRATIMPKSGITDFIMKYNKENGTFVLLQGGTATTSGKLRFPKIGTKFMLYQHLLDNIEDLKSKECIIEMKTKDIYKEFRLRGYDYGPEFQTIQQLNVHEKSAIGRISFKNWVTFVDGMIQTAVLGKPIRGLFVPVRLKYLCCDPKTFAENLLKTEQDSSIVLETLFDGILNIGVTKGIEFHGVKANIAPRKIHPIMPVEETYEFVPHNQFDMLYATSRSNSFQRRTYLTEQIKKYHDLCNQIIKNNYEQTMQSTGFNLEEYEAKVSEAILVKILKDIDWNNIENSLPLLDNIEEDLLFHTYFNEMFLRPQLETVTENLNDTTLEILEVNQSKKILSNRLLPWIRLSTFRTTFHYRLLHSALNTLNQDQLDSIYSQHEWLAEKSKFPTDLTDLDLIIFKDSTLCPFTAKHEINFESMLESMWNCLKDNRFGLILLRNNLFPVERLLMDKLKLSIKNEDRLNDLMNAINKSSFEIISHKSDQFGVHSVFIRKITVKPILENQHFINVTQNISNWFEQLQKQLKEVADDQTNQKFVWLLADEYHSGVIGFVNCLHREPIGQKVRCLINNQIGKPIDIQTDLVKDIIKKNLYLNALGPNGEFGSYRHFVLPLEENEPVPVQHCYLNVQTRGDLSSVRWFESQHKYWPVTRKPLQSICHVYYSALNFRDIMLASGKLPPDALPEDLGYDDCILGFEFAGRDENGNRIMGMVASKGLATSVVQTGENKFMWPIPAHWTMEEAATIPVAYCTAYYALLIRGQLKPKEKVLIHSGSGAVGQAAISICLHYNCELFVTVGSEEKRNLLMQRFGLKENQFASSRNTDFEKLISQATNGRGVDIVLNSLAEEKLQASVNCLAPNGRFLEIGKFDLSQDNKLNLSQIMKNKEFHGILLDNILNYGPEVPKRIDRQRDEIQRMICEGIEKGIVQPMNRTIFSHDKIEDAFRYMATGKHTGKVVIRIREEEDPNDPDFQEKLLQNSNLKIPAIPRTVFYPSKSYIITGGLGGFGLELMNWMIERDARQFVLTSRSGIKDLYQKTRLKYFADCGATVKIFTDNTLTREGVEKLVDEATKLGPLGGVFNLAMILSDGLFDNQTLDSFESVVKPKATTCLLLDQITRERSLKLDYFVAFSSVSCGMGNPGQTNYGYGNSVMERICDQRRRDGMHGFAIQWGPIGDVGYIIDNIRGNDVVVCGTIPQRIPSCLNALDRLLQSPYSVCSSLIKADHKFEASCGKTSLIKSVAHILGIKDYESLEPNVTLAELGMDSLMAVEVKQAVERDYDIVLSMQDIRKLTVGRIIEISKGKSKAESQCLSDNQNKNGESIDEKLVPTEPITYLNDIINGDPIIFLPQLDGSYEHMIPIARKLNRPVIGINWTKECGEFRTVPETASYFIKTLEQVLPNLTNNYDLIAYSYGGIIAFEMGLQLQQRKNSRLQSFKKLILLDSSPKQFKIYIEEICKKFSIENKKFDDQAYIETTLMFLVSKLPIDINKMRENLLKMENNEQRNQFVRDLFKQLENIEIKSETLEFLMQSHYNKMLMVDQYECQCKLNGDITLIRAADVLLKGENYRTAEDYWIGEMIDGKCNLHILKGDHKTFITDNYDEVTRIIRQYI